jgi:hypothetical protein
VLALSSDPLELCKQDNNKEMSLAPVMKVHSRVSTSTRCLRTSTILADREFDGLTAGRKRQLINLTLKDG